MLHVRIEFECDARDLDVVPGLEPLGLERVDHADPAQAALEVRQRIFVVEVVAGNQPLDPAPLTRKLRSPTRSTRYARVAAGRNTRCSASSSPRGDGASSPFQARSRRPAPGRAATSSTASSSSPACVTDEVRITGTSGPSRSTPLLARRRPGVRVDEVGLRQREDPRQRRQPRVVQLAARARRSRGCRPGRSRRAGARRARGRAVACARRGRGTRVRARRRRWRPRSDPGCRRSPAGGRRSSSVPSTGASVVNG